MQPNMAGEDPSLDGAVAAISAKLRGGAETPDKRENREDRDDLERQGTSDLDESDRLARRQASETNDGESQDAEAVEAEGAEKAEDDADTFIELPAAEEGGEPERVALKDAIEAVRQQRQMQGDITTAVIRAQDEEYAKQDKVTQALQSTFETVQQQAQAAMRMMHKFAPPEPDPIMLDRNSGYYNPEGYYADKATYDSYVAHYRQIEATLKSAQQGAKATGNQVDQEFVRRETERTAKFIPEFAKDDTRAAKKAEIVAALKRDYGLNDDDLADVHDHKAWRMLNDLVQLKAKQGKAPEVRKQLQESKPKILNGRASTARDPQTGQYINQARKELRETGDEAAFAKLLLRSGALKNR